MIVPSSDILLDRMMSLHPKFIDLTLDRMWRILAALGHPERTLPPVIHIAGTNGKGSTLAMIRAGLEGAGHTAHAYTSPHLVRFHERIRVAGELIAEPALAAVLDECLAVNGQAPITYFEITTAAALSVFARTPADYTLLEVGLGGRLDATNVVDHPTLTVITPIDMDHQQFLGDTIKAIATEKAGILKRGVPCIVARQADAALAVIEAQAARIGAPLLIHGQHWHVTHDHGRLVFQDETGLLDLPRPRLIGAHQIDNAGTALAALRHLAIGDTAYEAAMTRVEWPARLQRLRHGPLTTLAPEAELWLDGGHNPHAGRALAAALATMPQRATHLVCGMLEGKDSAGFLKAFKRQIDMVHTVPIPDQPAAWSAHDIAARARDTGYRATAHTSVPAAIKAIVGVAPRARILIGGSLYLAGDILRHNG